MRSGWFFGTPQWADYEAAYGRRLWRSVPLSPDHDFSDLPADWELQERQTWVVDLTRDAAALWLGVRKSYRPLITRALRDHLVQPAHSWQVPDYHRLHAETHGRETRSQATWDCFERWAADGHGLLVMARDQANAYCDGAYFLTHRNGAYYASATKTSGRDGLAGVHHAVLWMAIKELKRRGIHWLEIGDIGGSTDKERGIALFKSGWPGVPMMYLLACPKGAMI